jgi:hypothetical protein
MNNAYSFRGIDWRKVGKGALIAVAGALLTYGTTFVSGTDFGAYTPLVVAVWGVVVNVAHKYVQA